MPEHLRPPLPLFVFGTLRRGEENHHYLAGHYLRQLSALLPGFERIEPLMIARSSTGSVPGELYFIRPEIYAETLRNCDDLEGIPAGADCGPEYRRIEVTVDTPEGSYSAWAYVHPDTAAG
jgi:gamma-glutamylcyclotransferase (GGCT)/AIG2-like uncharacterized protein YtfP